eukprot:5750251-Pyramimonas_sp.AAC.1
MCDLEQWRDIVGALIRRSWAHRAGYHPSYPPSVYPPPYPKHHPPPPRAPPTHTHPQGQARSPALHGVIRGELLSAGPGMAPCSPRSRVWSTALHMT